MTSMESWQPDGVNRSSASLNLESSESLRGSPPIFEQDWWLDAAAPGQWQRVEERWDNVLVGSMAFCMSRRFGVRFIRLPRYTRTLSPILSPPPGRAIHRLAHRVTILEALLAKLPTHERFELCLRPNCESVLPFVMLNYAVAHTYTFQYRGSEFPVERMHQKTRNVVTKARRDFNVEVTTDLDRFLAIHRGQRATDNQDDYATVARLYEASRKHRCADILVAVNDRGEDCASAILVRDQETLYYWLSARLPERAANNGNSLLILHAGELAAARGLTFDVDGFLTRNMGLFLAKFGLDPVVRPYVNGSGMLWKLLNLATTFRRDRWDQHYRF